jgi:hypothetical protein
MPLDTARRRLGSLVPFPMSFASSPKRICDRAHFAIQAGCAPPM